MKKLKSAVELLITAGVIYPRIPQSPYSPSPIFGKFILAPGVYIIPNKPSLGHFLNLSSSSPHSSSVNWKPLICVANINKPRMCPAARINQHLLYPHHHVGSIVYTKPAGLPMISHIGQDLDTNDTRICSHRKTSGKSRFVKPTTGYHRVCG